jgi:RNA recognition motif-containing protein
VAELVVKQLSMRYVIVVVISFVSKLSMMPRRRDRSPPSPPRSRPPPPSAPSTMSIFPVYVGNISAEVAVADLRALFNRVGRVLEVTILADYGFVTYADVAEAKQAIKVFDGYKMSGEKLKVDLSEELEAHLKREGGREMSQNRSKKSATPPPRRRRLPTPAPSARGTNRFGGKLIPAKSFIAKGRRNQRCNYSRSRSPPRARRGGMSPQPRAARTRSPSASTPSLSPPKDRLPSPKRRRRSPREEEENSEKGNVQRTNNVATKKVKETKTANEVDNKEDLREVLRKRRKSAQKEEEPVPSTSKGQNSSFKRENIKISASGENRIATVASANLHKLYIGNLFNAVGNRDVERLLEGHGKVLCVVMFGTFALVDMECKQEEADRAIEELNSSLWMDNNIVVKYNEPRPLSKAINDDEPREPRAKGNKASPSDEVGVMSKPESEVSLSRPKSKQPDRKMAARTFTVYSPTTAKSYLADVADIFSPFGRVTSCGKKDGDDLIVWVELVSSQRQALNCIRETNDIRYKGGGLSVKFAEWEEEDDCEFRRRHLLEFHKYPVSVVPPEVLQKRREAKQKTITETRKLTAGSQVPIGVLPPTSSLGAFGATDSKALNSLLLNLQQQRHQIQQKHQLEQVHHLELDAESVGPAMPLPTEDPESLSSVESEIHSVHARIVIVRFYTGYSFQMAKFTPGQMYVNGRRSLGYLIKNNAAMHTWPAEIKQFLHEGAKVLMDVRKMSGRELAETAETTSESILYTTPLVWKTHRPEEVISPSTTKTAVLKVVVTRLFPKWCIASHETRGEVFFSVDALFVKTSVLSAKEDSLLDHLAVGDLVAVHCTAVDDYLAMTETARGYAGFAGSTAGLKYRANLVWQIAAEVDPHVHKLCGGTKDDQVCDFLATSSTLTRQLPQEREASHTGWPGVVEEVHVPAGGIVLLDKSLGLDPDQRRVYFHRSRVSVNGAKISNSTSLSIELVPGDPVKVDVVLNREAGADIGRRPYVDADAFWVALSVQLNTRSRGARIAKGLRMEVVLESRDVISAMVADQIYMLVSICWKKSVDEFSQMSLFLTFQGADRSSKDDVYMGRIVYLCRPVEDNETGPVRAGVAVIDTGPFAGQKVEFERAQCTAFGMGLAKADLSQILSFGQYVFPAKFSCILTD